MHEVRFTPQGIHFTAYPFPGASVYPSGLLPCAEIRDLDPDDHPPSIRTNSGEVLFVPALYRNELTAYAQRHGLNVASHYDIHQRIRESGLAPDKAEATDDAETVEYDGDDDEPVPPEESLFLDILADEDLHAALSAVAASRPAGFERLYRRLLQTLRQLS